MSEHTSPTRTELRLLLVSPSDVAEERARVPPVVDELNQGLAKQCGLRIELGRWETDARPGLHKDGPQGLIDEVLDFDTADLVVGMFWTRFGTPTAGAESGTVHELEKSWRRWKEVGRPDVLLYFKTTPYSPKDAAEAEQWSEVLRFKERLPEQQAWWRFDSADDFETTLRKHLSKILMERTVAAPRSDWITPSTLDVPRFATQIERSGLSRSLRETSDTHSVVAVEGLSGTGKTFGVAGYLQSPERHFAHRNPLWYTVQTGDSADELIASISTNGSRGGASATSTAARCKELVRFLSESEQVLVIDDFQLISHEQADQLVQAFALTPPPAHLITISQEYVEPIRNADSVGHVPVRGFEAGELSGYLSERGLPQRSAQLIQRLGQVTDGLPLAASLFVTLTKDFGRDPEELLRGEMLATRRLRGWFEQIINRLRPGAFQALQFLSLSDGPFNSGIVRLALGAPSQGDTALLFEDLQRSYLVQPHSPFRWSVHRLLAQFSISALETSLRAEIHRAYAGHYARGAKASRFRHLPSDDIGWMIRACRHLQWADDLRAAEEFINGLADPMKSRGWYQPLRKMCASQVDSDPRCDPWIRYHLAHCLLILGEANEAIGVSTEGLRTTHLTGAWRVRLALARVQAEALDEIGDTARAIALLAPAIEVARSKAQPRDRRLIAHARSIEASLRTNAGELVAAKKIALDLIDDGEARADLRSSAVAAMRLGLVEIKEGRSLTAVANDRFAVAATLFEDSGDLRGVAWSTGLVGLAMVKTNEAGGMRYVQRSLEFRRDAGEISREYLAFLRELDSLVGSRHPVVREEVARVAAKLG